MGRGGGTLEIHKAEGVPSEEQKPCKPHFDLLEITPSRGTGNQTPDDDDAGPRRKLLDRPCHYRQKVKQRIADTPQNPRTTIFGGTVHISLLQYQCDSGMC